MDFTEERRALLERGERLWELLRAALEDHLDEPIRQGIDWRGRDVYAHFARWQAESIRAVQQLSARERWAPREEHEDVLNARWREEDSVLPSDVARERCERTRAELRELLLGLNEKQWQIFGRAASADINGQHYEHHLEAAGVAVPG